MVKSTGFRKILFFILKISNYIANLDVFPTVSKFTLSSIHGEELLNVIMKYTLNL